jgi:hypothetical protein
MTELQSLLNEKNISPELSDKAYLRNLAERLRFVPTMYGTDDYDIDRLLILARKLK